MAHISIGKTSKMCRSVGTSLEAGLNVVKVLQRESAHGSSRYRHQMDEVQQRVSRGATLAEAMGQSNGYFPPLVTELVGVGEETGRLEAVLSRLADHYDHLLKLRRVFLLGILWPGLQLLAAVMIVGGLILLPPLLLGVNVPVFGLTGVSGAIKYFAAIGILIVALITLSYALGAAGSARCPAGWS